jgi:hypothetical protein
MKASSEETRTNGGLLLTSLIKKSANPTAFSTITSTLIGSLQGKDGILSQVYQRQSVLLALTTCAEFANSFGKECLFIYIYLSKDLFCDLSNYVSISLCIYLS